MGVLGKKRKDWQSGLERGNR